VAEALRRAPELEIIILVANAPEEIAFEGQGENPAHKHGEYLQGKVLGRLLRQGHGRLGLFTLVKQQSVKASEKQFEESRGTAYGAGVIHIHAKLLIADDAQCLVSSANINGRSFNWDTELGCLWRERGDAIARFRRDLWSQLLGWMQQRIRRWNAGGRLRRPTAWRNPRSAPASWSPTSSAAHGAMHGLPGSSPTTWSN
jgi:phospholipase D1/2